MNSNEYSLKAYVCEHHIDVGAERTLLALKTLTTLRKTVLRDKLTVAQNVTKFFEIHEIRILIIGVTRFTAAPYTELMIL